jgi:hypothetical protein
MNYLTNENQRQSIKKSKENQKIENENLYNKISQSINNQTICKDIMTSSYSILQYIYMILLAIYNKIYFKLFIDRDNNIHYYQGKKDHVKQYVFQTYDIHDYESNIGYDLDIETDILYKTINDSYNHGIVFLAPIETTDSAESA